MGFPPPVLMSLGPLPDRRTDTLHALGDRALVDAMRAGDSLAIREFFLRFEGVLEAHAQRFGVSGGERDDAVGETLEDAAMALLAPNAPVPRSIPGNLVTALRHRLLNAQRGSRRAAARARDPGAPAEYSVDAALCSESTLRASAGPAWEPPRPSRVVASLVETLFADLSEEDRALLVWVSRHVSYRDIAQWLGIGYAAVGKRVERLRTRLRARAELHLASLDNAGRLAVETLLGRGAPSPIRHPMSAPGRPAAHATSGLRPGDTLPDRTHD